MSGDNTNLGSGRRVVWEGQGCRFAIEESEGGDVLIMRSGVADDGPTRSIEIPSEALASVTAWLWALTVRRVMSGVGQAMARACEAMRQPQTVAPQLEPTAVDLGQGCEP